MIYIGKLVISDEAIEIFKEVDIFRAIDVKANWNISREFLEVDCMPPEKSFSWSYDDLNSILQLPRSVFPYKAYNERERDSISIIFKSEVENDFCKKELENGKIFEFGKLLSTGFVLNVE